MYRQTFSEAGVEPEMSGEQSERILDDVEELNKEAQDQFKGLYYGAPIATSGRAIAGTGGLLAEVATQAALEGTQASKYTAPFWEWIYNWFGGHRSVPSKRIGGAR